MVAAAADSRDGWWRCRGDGRKGGYGDGEAAAEVRVMMVTVRAAAGCMATVGGESNRSGDRKPFWGSSENLTGKRFLAVVVVVVAGGGKREV
nr:hypothetical protein [Tanacetum cinerariifolium]